MNKTALSRAADLQVRSVEYAESADLVTTSLRQNPPPRVDRARSCLRLTAAEQTDEPLSCDHSEWEARRMRGRERKPKREELCDEDGFRTDRADSESIRCPTHSDGASGDAATRKVIRWSFLDSEGLNIVEPVEAEQNDRRRGVVVNLASWTDAAKTSLEPHDPESTDLVVDLETDMRH